MPHKMQFLVYHKIELEQQNTVILEDYQPDCLLTVYPDDKYVKFLRIVKE
jgi:hypothetical protein